MSFGETQHISPKNFGPKVYKSIHIKHILKPWTHSKSHKFVNLINERSTKFST